MFVCTVRAQEKPKTEDCVSRSWIICEQKLMVKSGSTQKADARQRELKRTLERGLGP